MRSSTTRTLWATRCSSYGRQANPGRAVLHAVGGVRPGRPVVQLACRPTPTEGRRRAADGAAQVNPCQLYPASGASFPAHHNTQAGPCILIALPCPARFYPHPRHPTPPPPHQPSGRRHLAAPFHSALPGPLPRPHHHCTANPAPTTTTTTTTATHQGAVGLLDNHGVLTNLVCDGGHFGEPGLISAAGIARGSSAVALKPSDVVALSRWDLQVGCRLSRLASSALTVEEEACDDAWMARGLVDLDCELGWTGTEATWRGVVMRRHARCFPALTTSHAMPLLAYHADEHTEHAAPLTHPRRPPPPPPPPPPGRPAVLLLIHTGRHA